MGIISITVTAKYTMDDVESDYRSGKISQRLYFLLVEEALRQERASLMSDRNRFYVG